MLYLWLGLNTVSFYITQVNLAPQEIVPLGDNIAITLWVQLQSQGKKHYELLPDMIELPNYSPESKYRIGMKVDRSQIAYLAIQEIRTSKQVEYKLGNLISKMFPGYILNFQTVG